MYYINNRLCGEPRRACNYWRRGGGDLRPAEAAARGEAARSVGISRGPGLVAAGSCDFRCAKAPRLRSSADLTPSAQAHLVDGPSLNADPHDLAAKQLMIAILEKQ